MILRSHFSNAKLLKGQLQLKKLASCFNTYSFLIILTYQLGGELQRLRGEVTRLEAENNKFRRDLTDLDNPVIDKGNLFSYRNNYDLGSKNNLTEYFLNRNFPEKLGPLSREELMVRIGVLSLKLKEARQTGKFFLTKVQYLLLYLDSVGQRRVEKLQNELLESNAAVLEVGS